MVTLQPQSTIDPHSHEDVEVMLASSAAIARAFTSRHELRRSYMWTNGIEVFVQQRRVAIRRGEALDLTLARLSLPHHSVLAQLHL
jgi:hypothetical protein